MHILVLPLLYIVFLLVPMCRNFFTDFQITFRFVIATTAEIFLVSTNNDSVFVCA